MSKLADYTTEELKRLTKLSGKSAIPGEYVCAPHTAHYFVTESYLVSISGGERSRKWNPLTGLRRVTSFTDPTELDPPQAEMVAELERRERRERPALANTTHAGRKVRHLRFDQEGIIVHRNVAEAFDKVWNVSSSTRQLHVLNLRSGDAYCWNAQDVELLD